MIVAQHDAQTLAVHPPLFADAKSVALQLPLALRAPVVLAMVDVEQQAPIAAQRTRHVGEDVAIRVVVEMSEALPHADDGIEAAVAHGERFHVAPYETRVGDGLRARASRGERVRVEIEPHHLISRRRERREMPAWPATEIEHLGESIDGKLSLDERDLRRDDIGIDVAQKCAEPEPGIVIARHGAERLLDSARLSSISLQITEIGNKYLTVTEVRRSELAAHCRSEHSAHVVPYGGTRVAVRSCEGFIGHTVEVFGA